MSKIIISNIPDEAVSEVAEFFKAICEDDLDDFLYNLGWEKESEESGATVSIHNDKTWTPGFHGDHVVWGGGVHSVRRLEDGDVTLIIASEKLRDAFSTSHIEAAYITKEIHKFVSIEEFELPDEELIKIVKEDN